MARTINMGKISFSHVGEYADNTTYTKNDVVYYIGNSYVCIVDSVVGVAPTTDPTQWKLFASRGEQGVQGERGVKGDTGAQISDIGIDTDGNMLVALSSADATAAELKTLRVTASALASAESPTADFDLSTNTVNIGIPKGDTGAQISDMRVDENGQLLVTLTSADVVAVEMKHLKVQVEELESEAHPTAVFDYTTGVLTLGLPNVSSSVSTVLTTASTITDTLQQTALNLRLNTTPDNILQMYPVPKSTFDILVHMQPIGIIHDNRSLEHPSTFTGRKTIAITVCGKNLLNPAVALDGFTATDESYSIDITDSVRTRFNSNPLINVLFPTTDTTRQYHLSTKITTQESTCILKPDTNYFQTADSTTGYSGHDIGTAVESPSGTFTITGDISTIYPDTTTTLHHLSWSASTNATVAVSELQLTSGTTVEPYEKYSGTTTTIALSTTGNDVVYSGTFNINSGVLTKTQYVYNYPNNATVIDSDTIVCDSNSVSFRFNLEKMSDGITEHLICSAFPNKTEDSVTDYCYIPEENHQQVAFKVAYSHFTDTSVFTSQNSTISDLKSALALKLNTCRQLSVVYTLATPVTVQLNGQNIKALSQLDKYTPRLNSVYCDTGLLTIGYAKSPIQEHLELNNK